MAKFRQVQSVLSFGNSFRILLSLLWLTLTSNVIVADQKWPFSGSLVREKGSGEFIIKNGDEGWEKALVLKNFEAWAIKGKAGWKIIKNNGKSLISDHFEEMIALPVGVPAILVNNNQQWGLLGTDGELLIEIMHNHALEVLDPSSNKALNQEQIQLSAEVVFCRELIQQLNYSTQTPQKNTRRLSQLFIDFYGPNAYLRALDQIISIEKDDEVNPFLSLLPIEYQDLVRVHLNSSRQRIEAMQHLKRVWDPKQSLAFGEDRQLAIEAVIAYILVVEETKEPFDPQADSRSVELIKKVLGPLIQDLNIQETFELSMNSKIPFAAIQGVISKDKQVAIKKMAYEKINSFKVAKRSPSPSSTSSHQRGPSTKLLSTMALCKVVSEIQYLPAFSAGDPLSALAVAKHATRGIVVIDSKGQYRSLRELFFKYSYYSKSNAQQPKASELRKVLDDISSGELCMNMGLFKLPKSLSTKTFIEALKQIEKKVDKSSFSEIEQELKMAYAAYERHKSRTPKALSDVLDKTYQIMLSSCQKIQKKDPGPQDQDAWYLYNEIQNYYYKVTLPDSYARDPLNCTRSLLDGLYYNVKSLMPALSKISKQHDLVITKRKQEALAKQRRERERQEQLALAEQERQYAAYMAELQASQEASRQRAAYEARRKANLNDWLNNHSYGLTPGYSRYSGTREEQQRQYRDHLNRNVDRLIIGSRQNRGF